MFHQFTNDYCELAHEKILSALQKYSTEQNPGYGLDPHTENAKKYIREKFHLSEDCDIHLLVGGTQTNMIVISYFLRPYEAVLACDTGHINVLETGAVEGSGHKVVTVPNSNGKILPKDIETAVRNNPNEHTVKIKMVYITNATENGSIYSIEELTEIRKTCDKLNLLLFLDGARLATALTSKKNNVKIEQIGQIADIFYIGGTKNGLMFGEAVVIKDKKMSECFRNHIKNKGGMLAKGYSLGIQFEELFREELFLDIAKNSNQMAEYIQDELKKIKGLKFYGESCTNQLFIQVANDKAEKLIKNFGLALWVILEEETVVRICTSYMTKKEHCDQIINYIKEMM